MKKLTLFFIILFFVFGNFINIYADTTDDIISSSGIYELNEELKELGKENEYIKNFDLVDIVKNTITSGEILNFEELFKTVLEILFKEIYHQGGTLRNLIFIVCICALTQNLSSSFESKSVGEITFYSCYIVSVMLLVQSFKSAADMTANMISKLSELLIVFLPVLSGLLISSGNYTTAAMFQPIGIFVGQIIVKLVENLIIALIISTTMLEIVNYLSPKDILGKLTKLSKKTISWGVKTMCMIFSGILTLNKVTAPLTDGMVNKTTKTAMGIIPVVGEVMEGSVDIVMGWTSLIKNGVVLGAIIFMIILSFFPVIKLAAMIFVYKFVSAIISPLTDKRLVQCIDSVADSCQLLLGVLVGVIFICTVIFLIGISITII